MSIASTALIPSYMLVIAALETSLVAKLCLFLAVTLTWALAAGKIGEKLFRIPPIAGQIIGGIILGPSCLDIARWGIFARALYVADHSTGLVHELVPADLLISFLMLISAGLTVSYILWVAGYETDLKQMKSVGLVAAVAGLLGALVPIGMAVGALQMLIPGSWNLVQSIGMGLVFSATSVSIPVAMLVSYHKMHLRSSKATLGAAVVDDIVAVMLLSLFFVMVQAGLFGAGGALISAHGHAPSLTTALLYLLGALAAMIAMGYGALSTVARALKRLGCSSFIAPAAMIGMLLYFAFAELVGGLAGITGAYFAGLFYRMGDAEHQAERELSPYVYAILLPLFLCSIGLHIDIKLLTMHEWLLVIMLLAVAVLSKMVACWIAVKLSSGLSCQPRWSSLETYLFGSSMVARGEVGLVVSTVLYGLRIMPSQQYIIAVVVIVLSTVVAPIMLAAGFKRQEAEREQAEVDHIG